MASSVGRHKSAYHAVKRGFDLVTALLGILLLWPLWMLTMTVIVLNSGWPPIFIHHRVGRNGRPLPLLKFRTMCRNAEQLKATFTLSQQQEWAQRCKLRDDPRITQVGHFLRRTGLDELPQLLNVLRGDMSLVGPRPITPEELARYGEQKALFLSVRPGLTGYWQAYADGTETYEQRMAMELDYAAHASLWWDIKILLRTVSMLLTGKKRV